MKSANLIENFVTWQGEGPFCGRRMLILRFKTCNRSCPWCDTAVKMRITAEASHKFSDIQQNLKDNQAGLLITGGEPTVARHIKETACLLNNLEYPLANVETNGFALTSLIKIIYSKKPVYYMYSPKIFNEEDYNIAVNDIKEYVNNKSVYFKIVVDGSYWVDKYIRILGKYDNKLQNEGRIWAMAQGATREEIFKNVHKVFDLCEKYNFCFSSRDQIIYQFL